MAKIWHFSQIWLILQIWFYPWQQLPKLTVLGHIQQGHVVLHPLATVPYCRDAREQLLTFLNCFQIPGSPLPSWSPAPIWAQHLLLACHCSQAGFHHRHGGQSIGIWTFLFSLFPPCRKSFGGIWSRHSCQSWWCVLAWARTWEM